MVKNLPVREIKITFDKALPMQETWVGSLVGGTLIPHTREELRGQATVTEP